MKLYVDDYGYICFDQTINTNFTITWTLHRFGWSVYFGETEIYEFEELYTYPTKKELNYIDNMLSNFRQTPFGNWEVSWISNKEYCRKHKQFDNFDNALKLYRELEAEGEL